MNAPLTITHPATIGAPFKGGFYGGLIRMREAVFAVIWAPKAEGENKGAWLPDYTEAPGALSCVDSEANTRAMAEAGSELAKWALGLEINGVSGWVLPARDVLELAYRHLKPTDDETGDYFRDGDNPSSVPVGYPYANSGSVAQTEVAEFREGGPQAFDAAWYWSSTQYSEDDAWYQRFGLGCQDSLDKRFQARARAVRLIQLTT